MKFHPGILLAFILLVTGCATWSGTEVNTWRNPDFLLTPTNTVAFVEQPRLTPEDAELGRLLTEELQRAGFSLVPANRAEYLLSYLTDHVTDVQPYWRNQVANQATPGNPLITASPQTSAGVVESSYTTVMDSTVHAFVFHNKEITLYVYTNPKTHPGGLNIAWQGAINAGQSATQEQERILIRTLLGYFGKAQDGNVDLAK